ncbi:SusC/RagA family TonB-linked outer membrane protein [Parapedobacter soli]|uniref:SusC/RagA family TonB-linked outer membrane protein n=1 Tax=Parapedobacter soli TaxID=416955 RepID=UPI0021C93585|nr:TonB-dependent receptor [Parapedobacter soli]
MDKHAVKRDISLTDRKHVLMVKKMSLFLLLSYTFLSLDLSAYPSGYRTLDTRYVVGSPLSQQQRQITGIITDVQGAPIIGANIVEVGTANGTTTDSDGRFSLRIGGNASIKVSYTGYLVQEINTDGRTSFNITLIEDNQALDEVVVVGYGTQKKVNLTGSVASVTIDEKITSRSLTNVSSGLQGLVPGLQVAQTTSMAGRDGASLIIRGLGTVNNASPLVVVDGMPDVDINRINFADIESISVLKDAASASIYGSRAANGVILVTTRTGKGAERTQINFNSSLSVERPTRSYEFMADYPRALTIHQYRAASGTLRDQYIFKDGTIDQWLALGMIDPLRYPNTDWFDTFMRDGSVQNYNVSASGGGERSNFYISVGSLDNKGIQMHNDYSRYNTRFNFDYDISKLFTVGARFDGNWSEFTYSGYADGLTNNDTSDSGGGDMQYAIAGVLPYDPVSGRYGGAMAYGEDLQAYNPYAYFNSRRPHQTEQQVNGNMYIDFTPFKGFTAHLDYSLSYNNYFQKRADMPTGAAYNFQTDSDLGRNYVADNTSVSDNNTTSYKTQLNARLNYQTTIAENHNINALFVYSEEYWHTRSTGASRNDRLHPSITEINGALTNVISNSGSSASEGLRSYIGRLNYDAYDKYLFEFNFRVDGSSKFAEGSRYGFFPSVAVGWRFTEEAFLAPVLDSWMSNGKIRASYGTTGNNSGVGRFEQLETLTAMNYMADDVVKGFVNRKMINKDLSWEESRVLNIGLDMGFVNNRLTTELDYYDRLTSGMNRPSEMSMLLTGAYTAPRRNIGDLRNRGMELNLTWNDKIGMVNYSVGVNGAHNRTRLEEWNEFLGRGWVFIDMPYHFLYAYQDAGMAQTWEDIYSHTPQGLSPGDVIREDLNGDGIIDGKDRKAYPDIQRDRPTTTFGLTLAAAWKGFDLSALFNGATGRKDFWVTDFNNTSMGDRRYASTWDHWNNPWSLENRDTDWPRLGTSTNRSDNSFYLYDLSYLRLKNLQLGYKLPSTLLSRIHVSSLRFYVSAENLFTLTAYPGLDPEKERSARDLYPINRSYSAGLSLGL